LNFRNSNFSQFVIYKGGASGGGVVLGTLINKGFVVVDVDVDTAYLLDTITNPLHLYCRYTWTFHVSRKL